MPIDLRMTREERERFLADHLVGVLSIGEPDGGTLATPVWYEYADGLFTFVFDEGSRKERAIERTMRLSITVEQAEMPMRYVTATGPVTEMRPFEAERDLASFWDVAVRALGSEEAAERYASLGADRYLRDLPSEGGDAPGVVVKMRPERWLSTDYGKSGDRLRRVLEG